MRSSPHVGLCTKCGTCLRFTLSLPFVHCPPGLLSHCKERNRRTQQIFSPESYFLLNVRGSQLTAERWAKEADKKLSYKFIDYLCSLPSLGLIWLWIYHNREKRTLIVARLEMSFVFTILRVRPCYSTVPVYIFFPFEVMLNFHYMQMHGCVWCICYFKSH